MAIAAGGVRSLALTSNGTVVALGTNPGCGRGEPPNLNGVIAIAAGGFYSLALKSDGTVVAWGEIWNGRYEPVTVPDGLGDVVAIAAGRSEGLALVSPPVPPCVLTCPTNIAVCNDPGGCGAFVHFALPAATNCQGSIISCVPSSGSFFPPGTNTVLCMATNAAGQVTDSCGFQVVVRDCEPPAIHGIATSPDVLWPPNHRMQPVTLSVSVADNCRLARSKIISITSSEPADAHGGGSTPPDWEITGDLTVKLRAERSGTGTGRIYTVTVECADDSGNLSTTVARVTVPQSISDVSTPLSELRR